MNMNTNTNQKSSVSMSSTAEEKTATTTTTTPNYNSVFVAKEGGQGMKSASELMGASVGGKQLSLGAPPPRPPRGGTFITKGGVTIDATVRPLRYTHGGLDECFTDDEEGCDDVFVSPYFKNHGGEAKGYTWGSEGAIDQMVDLLDTRRGGLLTSSYEFPGR